jgi:hypothetical protein
MKKMCCLLLLFTIRIAGFSQSQDIQQLVMDIEKLAQLKAMYQSMVNGYNTLTKGYNNVINISKGNFELHKNYLNGLLDVTTPVKKYGGIEVIATTQDLIQRENAVGYQKCVSSQVFTNAELSERQQQGFRLLDESVKRLEELLLVVRPGKLRMTDEERMSVIDRIDVAMRGLLAELRKINLANDELFRLRVQRQKDIKAMKSLNGIK